MNVPVKRRYGKRRTNDAAELAAWRDAFLHRWDFFRDLEEFGLGTDEAVAAAFPEAWARLGGAFLDQFEQHPSRSPEPPYGLVTYGDPRNAS
ncbi:hypothetical protein [Mesorhizobium sp. CN2-181]|uniref:hypothetical protein n=1 Tax=Mesorhizobium yinganensis TaxID=3157707 RepID=UPI0032B76C6C